MSDEQRKATIERYLAAYNRFDVDGMLAELAPEVRFENVAGGEVNAEASGIEAFRRLAEQARQLFSEREQRVTALAFDGDTARATIGWRGRFAVDVPGGLQAGTLVELQGESEFTFDGARIVRLVDRS
jgi:ketosteroid isomerase-like protein